MQPQTPPYSTSPLFNKLKCVQHGFFGSQGGVSTGLYASLNCGHSSQDEHDLVAQNRLLIAKAFKVDEPALFSLRQHHSTTVISVQKTSPPQFDTLGDAMVSNQVGVALGALGADCAPVLLVDPVHRVIAAAHSGWKGALGGVNEATIAKMCALGAQVGDIKAAIGPAMQQRHYEVKADFRALFEQQSPIDSRPFFKAVEAKLYFDTPAYIKARLLHYGVHEVDVSKEDTFSQPQKFFSYRRAQQNGAQDYGRQIAVIALNDEKSIRDLY